LLRCERHLSAQSVWDAIKIQYGETSTTRLRQLILKFDSYKKHQNQTMIQHLTVMSNIISELRGVRHEMTDKQQVQAVIRSLPSNWEDMRVNLTHNDNIKTFDDVARHVELEKDRLHTKKPIFTILLINMGNLVLGGRCVFLYDILNIPKDLCLLVKKLMEK
jgi:hypothetical protein